MAQFAGIMPALLTPTDTEGKILVGEIDRLVNHLYQVGVHGLYICGTSGEGLLLSLSEREQIAEQVVKSTAGRGKVIVHVGAIATDDSVHLTKHAERIGADAVASIPPFTYGKDPAGTRLHYEAISNATRLPLFLYNIPSLTGVNMSVNDVRRLLDLRGVIGLKFSDSDLFAEFRLIHVREGFEVLHGCDETLAYALMMGAVGGVGLIYNFLPKTFVSIFEFVRDGKLAEANALQKKASLAIGIFLEHAAGSPVGFAKAVLQAQGFRIGNARLPNRRFSDEAVKVYLADLDRNHLNLD